MKPLFFASRLSGFRRLPALVSTAGRLAYTFGFILRSFAFVAVLLILVLPLTALVFFSPAHSPD